MPSMGQPNSRRSDHRVSRRLPACAAPSWATYSGRWGINVDFSTTVTGKAARSCDALGRGVSYWTLKSMVRFALETSAGL